MPSAWRVARLLPRVLQQPKPCALNGVQSDCGDMMVADASALIEVFPDAKVASRIGKRLSDPNEALHAPHLIDLDVVQVMRRYVLAKQLTRQRGSEAVQDLQDIPLIRYPHTLFVNHIRELRNNATAYDAVYLVLAETLNAPLMTCDSTLASVPGHRARVAIIA